MESKGEIKESEKGGHKGSQRQFSIFTSLSLLREVFSMFSSGFEKNFLKQLKTPFWCFQKIVFQGKFFSS